jgi:hypothetical protein
VSAKKETICLLMDEVDAYQAVTKCLKICWAITTDGRNLCFDSAQANRPILTWMRQDVSSPLGCLKQGLPGIFQEFYQNEFDGIRT